MSVTVQARRIFGKLRIVDVGRCRRSGLRWLNTSESNVDAKQFADFKRNLRNKQVPCKDGNACLQVECRLCSDLRRSSAYINKRTGLFLCPNCDIQKNLSDVVAAYEKNSTDLLPREVVYKSRLRGLGPITQVACDAVAIKGLNVTDLEAVGAKFDASDNVLQFPLKNAAEKVVGEKLIYLTDKTEETLQNPSFSGLLIFGPRTHKGRLVLVSNIPDFLVLVMQRIENLCIACLPYGLGALPQECLPNLERFKEVVFWFDCDSTGWDVAKTFSKKLDEKRCFLIRPTETEPAPHEAHHKRLNIRHILFKATPMRHKSITTFSALRNDILSELQNIEKVNGVKWKRFPVLNKLLMGHRKGELTILTGPTGSGKTTFMSEYSLDLALQGVSTLWGSFEIRNCRLAATLLRQFVGYSLENKLDEFDRWASALEKYPLYFMTFHGQQPLKLVMDAVEHAQYVHDISHVIIDNLQFMMGTSAVHRLDKFWEQDAIIGAFRAFATKNNVHVTLVMHPRKERAEDDLTASSVFGTAKATQEADNVLIIQDKRLTSIRGKKYLQVVKNRYSGDLGIMPLDFNKESLSYATINKKKNGKGK